jgi:hypothetical protein
MCVLNYSTICLCNLSFTILCLDQINFIDIKMLDRGIGKEILVVAHDTKL